MISTGNRNPRYDGVSVPTSPAPSTLYPTDPPIIPATAASQVDGANARVVGVGGRASRLPPRCPGWGGSAAP
jgi:hypothetical protein